MTDDSHLEEILRSPLDEEPEPAPRWLPWLGAFVAAIVLGFVGIRLIGGGDAAVDTSVAGTTIASDSSGSTVPGATDGETTTTSTPPAAVYPEPTVFSEMVAIGDGELLMFGGFIPLPSSTAPLEGTWRFDATDGLWSVDYPGVTPTPRYGHAMAFHPPTGRVVVFGGGTTTPRPCPRIVVCPGPEDNQLWQYDPETGIWENMTPADPDEATWPIPRFGARFAYEPVTERLILFSGVGVFGVNLTPNFWTDTWAYDPATNTWEDLTDPEEGARPPGRVMYGFVWNEEAERILMFAGDGIPAADDNLWAFDPATGAWEDLGEFDPGEGPKDRWFHLLTTDPRSGRVVLIGGNGSIYRIITGGTIRNNGNLREVWTWSPAEGWVAQNELEGDLVPVTGAGDQATMDVIVYAGRSVWAYDVAVDAWAVLWERPTDEE